MMIVQLSTNANKNVPYFSPIRVYVPTEVVNVMFNARHDMNHYFCRDFLYY